jgi:hypothetical protein
VSAINFAIAAAGYNVAVFNLFTGTIPLDSTSLLPPTTYQWSPVTFDPLTPADGITLLKSQHPSLKETLQEPRISILFETFGNVPRVWELFSRELEKNPTAFSSTKSVVELCNAFAQLDERWTIPIQQLHTAILVMVQRWTMADIEALRKPEIDRVVKILLYEGRLFTREGGTFYVPLIFLRNSVKALAQEDPCREIFLEYANKCLKGQFDDRKFERFCLSYLVIKFNMFVTAKLDGVCLAQLFKGAWMKKVSKKGLIRIGDNPIGETFFPAQLTHSRTRKHMVLLNAPMDIRDEIPIAFWVGKSDSHQDALLLLPDNVSIHLEMKFATVQGACIGNDQTSFTHEQELAENSPVRQMNSFFLYITNQRLKKETMKELMHDRSFIVCANNFSEFYSGIFSFVTKLC